MDRSIKNPASAVDGLPDVRMATLSSDITMETARSGTTLKKNKFQLWERELLESPEVRRKSTVAQLCTWCRTKTRFMLNSSLQISLITISNSWATSVRARSVGPHSMKIRLHATSPQRTSIKSSSRIVDASVYFCGEGVQNCGWSSSTS
jgi:hypothetical protein